jgi:hypothetical protein
MNFVDAAVTLLREVNEPLHVEELCRLALERGLLDSPGQSPLRSLKGRLTTELKRGPDSRVVRVEDDLWALADAGRNGVEAVEEEVTAPEIEPVSAPPGFGAAAGSSATDAYEDALAGELADQDDDEEDDDDDEEDDDDLAVEDDGLAADDEDADEDAGEDDLDDDEDEGGGADQAASGGGEHVAQGEGVDEGEELFIDVDMEGDDPEPGAADAFEEEDTQVRERAAQAEQARALERDDLSSEEKELIQSFGAESGTAQVGDLVEYRDSQTADEDRPMVPEMLPERRGGRQREDWKARRERMREKRRERREGRERNKGGRDQGARDQGARDQAAPAVEAGEGRAAPERAPEAADGESRPVAPVGEGDLARRACEVLASIKGAQPVPVRQLAQMMRKRRLVDAEPEQLWRPLKSALLADHQRRAAAGLPPRVAYRGRDLFAYRPSANAELEAAEIALETAAHRLRGATERALAARLVELSLPVLEQVVQLYLVQTGWREVEWIKRVDRSGYAVAREPGDGQQIMISARAGNQEVDRRGVGELRAGVAAKNMSRGLLLAPRELGSEARAELERPGKPVGAMCGLPWASALVEAGIGVALRMMPVAYLEAELFDRLSEG